MFPVFLQYHHGRDILTRPRSLCHQSHSVLLNLALPKQPGGQRLPPGPIQAFHVNRTHPRAPTRTELLSRSRNRGLRRGCLSHRPRERLTPPNRDSLYIPLGHRQRRRQRRRSWMPCPFNSRLVSTISSSKGDKSFLRAKPFSPRAKSSRPLWHHLSYSRLFPHLAKCQTRRLFISKRSTTSSIALDPWVGTLSPLFLLPWEMKWTSTIKYRVSRRVVVSSHRACLHRKCLHHRKPRRRHLNRFLPAVLRFPHHRKFLLSQRVPLRPRLIKTSLFPPDGQVPANPQIAALHDYNLAGPPSDLWPPTSWTWSPIPQDHIIATTTHIIAESRLRD